MRSLRLLGVCTVLLTLGCSDNAVHFRGQVERAVSRIAGAGGDAASEPLVYVPVASATKPYWVILFPDRVTTLDELVTEGLPAPIAHQIFEELAYIGVGEGDMVVVWQEGERLSFQSYYGKTRVGIEDLIVIRGTGETTLILQRSPAGEYRLAVPR